MTRNPRPHPPAGAGAVIGEGGCGEEQRQLQRKAGLGAEGHRCSAQLTMLHKGVTRGAPRFTQAANWLDVSSASDGWPVLVADLLLMLPLEQPEGRLGFGMLNPFGPGVRPTQLRLIAEGLFTKERQCTGRHRLYKQLTTADNSATGVPVLAAHGAQVQKFVSSNSLYKGITTRRRTRQKQTGPADCRQGM